MRHVQIKVGGWRGAVLPVVQEEPGAVIVSWGVREMRFPEHEVEERVFDPSIGVHGGFRAP